MNIVTVDLGASMVSSAARDTDRKKILMLMYCLALAHRCHL